MRNRRTGEENSKEMKKGKKNDRTRSAVSSGSKAQQANTLKKKRREEPWVVVGLLRKYTVVTLLSMRKSYSCSSGNSGVTNLRMAPLDILNPNVPGIRFSVVLT